MKRKTKILISTICALVMCFGIVGGVSAENVTEMKSKGIIRFTGDNVNDTSDDIVFDASDLTTLEQRVNNADKEVKQGKKSVADAMDSETSTSTSDTNKTKFNVSNDENYTNLPDYAKLVEGIAKVKAVGKEEGINSVWAEIKSGLADKKDSAGNPIYAGVTDLDSLKNAITADNDNLKNNIKKNPSAYGIESSVKVVRTGKGDLSIKMSDNGLTDYDVNHYILQVTSAPATATGQIGFICQDHRSPYCSGFNATLSINEANDTLSISGTTITAYDSFVDSIKRTTTCNWKLWHIE